MASSLGHPLLGTTQAKSYLKRLGNTTEERITALAEGIDLQSVKEYWYNLLENKIFELEVELNKYEEEKSRYIHKVAGFLGRHARFTYSEAIDRRTKETFAQTFEEIKTCRNNVSQVYDTAELLNILVGEKLKEIE